MKPFKDCEPITFPLANGTMHGTNDVHDLPVCRTIDGYVVSCWKIPFIKRILLLFSGRIYLVVRGSNHPPVYVDTDVFEKIA